MAKKPESAAATLNELQSAGDRLAEWAAANPAILLGTAVAILVLAGSFGLVRSLQSDSLDEASAALARVETDYREAMGAPADAIEVVEPANPQTALSARTRFVAAYREVAEAHAGTSVAPLAWLQVGNLETALGDSEKAIRTWTDAAAELGSDEIARAMLLARIAAEQEALEEWLAAAEAHEEASGVMAYPLRHAALADAARCLIEAGEFERALQVFDRLEVEAPEYVISEVTRARLLEMRAAAAVQSESESEATAQ